MMIMNKPVYIVAKGQYVGLIGTIEEGGFTELTGQVFFYPMISTNQRLVIPKEYLEEYIGDKEE